MTPFGRQGLQDAERYSDLLKVTGEMAQSRRRVLTS